MIRLGGVELSEHLYLEPDPRNIPRVGISQQRCMGFGGDLIIDVNEVNSGQEIALVDRSTFGAFKGSQIDALRPLYDAGTEILFEHHIGQWMVLIKSLDVEDSDDRNDPDGDSDFMGQINMVITKFL